MRRIRDNKAILSLEFDERAELVGGRWKSENKAMEGLLNAKYSPSRWSGPSTRNAYELACRAALSDPRVVEIVALPSTSYLGSLAGDEIY